MKRFKEYILITIGFILVAISLQFFLTPNKIAGGGVFGIALIINNFMPTLSIGMLMLIMNVFLFIIAFIVIGNKFGAKSIYASIGLSGTTWLMEKVFPVNTGITTNLFLATVFGTIISGIGMGLVFNQNASTGGTDILAKILNKFFHIDIGKSLLSVDFIVSIIGGASFGIDAGMFALLSVVLNGFIIDNVIEGLNIRKQIIIISNNYDDIRNFIINELERGCTIIKGEGGYSSYEKKVLYTVLSRKEFIILKNYIKNIDSEAFIVVNDVHEVLGIGFKNAIADE